MVKRPLLPPWPLRSPRTFWVSAAVLEVITAFLGGVLLILLVEVWPKDGIIPLNALGQLLLAVVGIALIVGVPVIVAVSSPGSDALGIATRSGSMLALLFALFIIGALFPYWRGWFELEDQDIRDFYPLVPWSAVVGFVVGFLGGLIASAVRYNLRVNRRHD
ncbi:MAG: hypothetical protein AAB092_05915 [Chloroflexota bacterium]